MQRAAGKPASQGVVDFNNAEIHRGNGIIDRSKPPQSIDTNSRLFAGGES
jgi:hypothetical protein